MPTKDSIIEEIHSVRAAIARESGNDLDRIIDAARARQSAEGRQVVQHPPKKVPAFKKA